MTTENDPEGLPDEAPARPDLPDDPGLPERARRPWMAGFIVALGERGIVADACRAAGIGRSQAYQWRQDDPLFAMEWDDAHQHAMDTLEAEAVRRAVEGVAEPVFYKGEKIETVQKYSDVLLMFLLNGGRSEKYRRGSVDVNVKLDQQATDIIGALADELTEAVADA